MDIWVNDVQFGTQNYIGLSLMENLCNFWCETKSPNSNWRKGINIIQKKYAVIAAGGQPTPWN